MLYLISIGLHDEKDMSIRALETARKCDKLFAEFYTVRLDTDANKLGEFVGKKVEELGREDVENGKKILELAKTKDIGILVGGDAMTATTHISLLTDAKNMGIETRVIHGSSVYTAVCKTGLQIYKFGRTTTLPRNGTPQSVRDVIKQNKKRGLHTLVLLDIGMHAKKGLKNLLSKDITEETEVVVCCKLGGDEEVMKYGKIKNLLDDKEIEKTPAVIILPGKLHFKEREALELLGD